MKSRFDMLKELGIRRVLALTGTSFALYAVAMLTVSLLAQSPATDTMAGANPQAERVVLHFDALTPTELDLI